MLVWACWKPTVRPGRNYNRSLKCLGLETKNQAQKLGGAATIHTFIPLSIKMLKTMNEPSSNEVEKERSPFPGGSFSFLRDSVFSVEMVDLSSGCTSETGRRPAACWKMSNCPQAGTRHLGELDPPSRELFPPSVPIVRITLWTAHLVIWSSRGNRHVRSVLLLGRQKLEKSPKL